MRWIMGLVRLGLLAGAVALTAGYLGRFHPALDSFSHFRVQFAALLVLAGLVVFAWHRLEGSLALLMGGAALLSVVGGLPGLGSVHAAIQPRDDSNPTYKLLQMNLLYNNAEPERVLSMIGRVKPDVITLEEVSERWWPKIDVLQAAYPHRIVCRLDSRAGGVAILSLRPFVGEPQCIDGGVVAAATVDFSGRQAEVVAVHLHWPWPLDQWHQVEGLTEGPIKEIAPTAIMAGDFNAAPWSATVRRMAAAGGFSPVAGIGPTWMPLRLPEWLRFAGLPIDNVLTKGDVQVHGVQRLDPAGSDHLPVLLEFSIKPTEKPAEPGQVSMMGLARSLLPVHGEKGTG